MSKKGAQADIETASLNVRFVSKPEELDVAAVRASLRRQAPRAALLILHSRYRQTFHDLD